MCQTPTHWCKTAVIPNQTKPQDTDVHSTTRRAAPSPVIRATSSSKKRYCCSITSHRFHYYIQQHEGNYRHRCPVGMRRSRAFVSFHGRGGPCQNSRQQQASRGGEKSSSDGFDDGDRPGRCPLCRGLRERCGFGGTRPHVAFTCHAR